MEQLRIDSIAQLIKNLSDIDLVNTKQFYNIVEAIGFEEDYESTYNNLGVEVSYKLMPVAIGAEVHVKVVLLRQADKIVLTMPQDIVEAYKEILDNLENLDTINRNFSLYSEIYGFDSKDLELQKLIKRTYLYAGNSQSAFEVSGELAKEKTEQGKPEAKDSELDDLDFPEIEDNSDLDFGVDDIADIPELGVNKEAFKKFKKQTKYLEKFIRDTITKKPTIIRDNVKFKFISNVLLVEVNNKNIYETLDYNPKIPKFIISNFGESVKDFHGIQLIDSFNRQGRRYFVLAEDAGNNYWNVINEAYKLLPSNNKRKVIVPLEEDIITLNRSSIRENSRKNVCFLKENKLVYIKK